MDYLDTARRALLECPSFAGIREREINLDIAPALALVHHQGGFWAFVLTIEAWGPIGAGGKHRVVIDADLPVSKWADMVEPYLAAIIESYELPAAQMFREVNEEGGE